MGLPDATLHHRRRRLRIGPAAPALAILALAGCTTVIARFPVAEADIDRAAPYGIEAPLMRSWGDGLDAASIDFIVEARATAFAEANAAAIARGETIEIDSLALSGGGAGGAFGAGLMAGWTARGDRPEFEVVSGVSTGAIVALFAFLGPEYDEALSEIYTEYETDDLVVPAIFAGLLGGTALLDTSGYERLVADYVTPAIVAELAEAYAANRLLLIGTTNIDASRPVIWNLGAIAASGHADAERLIEDVIRASSAIPAAFPPALIPVEVDGRTYDEMHVDGGATQQVSLFSPQLRTTDIDARAGGSVARRLWVVMNNNLDKAYDPVRPRLGAIAGRSASSLIGGSGTGDLYRLYAVARRDGIALNVVAIPQGFDVEAEEMFDPVYMGALYDLGYETGLAGTAWSAYPPDFAPPEPDRSGDPADG